VRPLAHLEEGMRLLVVPKVVLPSLGCRVIGQAGLARGVPVGRRG
jgi:hypothetical protein